MNIRPWFNIGGLVASVWRALMEAAPVKIWAQIGAAVAASIMAFLTVVIIYLGPWPSEREGQRLDLVFYLAVGMEVWVLVALAAITSLNVTLHGGKDGLHASIDQDEQPSVTIATTTTVTPDPGVKVETDIPTRSPPADEEPAR